MSDANCKLTPRYLGYLIVGLWRYIYSQNGIYPLNEKYPLVPINGIYH